MSTQPLRIIFTPYFELCQKVQSEVDKKVGKKRKLNPKKFRDFLSNESEKKKGKAEEVLRILCLSSFLTPVMDDEKREVYITLAPKIAELGPEELEIDFLEYLLVITKDAVVKAMCHVVWYLEEYELPFETFQKSCKLLKQHNLDQFFLYDEVTEQKETV